MSSKEVEELVKTIDQQLLSKLLDALTEEQGIEVKTNDKGTS